MLPRKLVFEVPAAAATGEKPEALSSSRILMTFSLGGVIRFTVIALSSEIGT